MKPPPALGTRPARFGGALGRCLAVLALALVGTGGPPVARAHDVFTAYIQHRIELTLGARYTDVTIELTFFEDTSEHEREHLDADGDGRISRAESNAYIRHMAAEAEKQVRLLADGRELALTSLYAPRLDLLGDNQVGRSHHRLTLYFFAATPDDLTPGTEFVVADRCWPAARALGSLEVKGADGSRLEVEPRGDPVFPPARDGAAREFRARCLIPPRSQATK